MTNTERASSNVRPGRSSRTASRLVPALIAIGAMTLTVAGTVLLIRNGETLIDGFNLTLVVVGIVYAAAGWLLRVRVPRNAMGTVFLATAVAWSLAFVLDEYARYAVITAPGTLPGGPMALWLGAWIWIPGTALLFFAMPILFPDGHLPSPRWRPVAALVVVGTVLSMVGHAAVVWPLRDTMLPFGPNFIAADQPGLGGMLASIGDLIMFIPAPMIAVVALVMRYRRSTGVAREQMRLLTFTIVVTIPIAVSTQLVNTVIPLANAVAGVAIAFIPIALTAAILRYHLYDIDRIIGRTLAYAVVTSLLAAVFVASNLLLQAAVAGAMGDSTIAVAGSTLLVATLFQPIRRRIQAPVDRRFNRAHHDAERMVGAFGHQTRDEVDLERLVEAVVDTVDRAIAPRGTVVWLRPAGDRT